MAYEQKSPGPAYQGSLFCPIPAPSIGQTEGDIPMENPANEVPEKFNQRERYEAEFDEWIDTTRHKAIYRDEAKID